jgi:hypothetical protein
MGILFSKKEEDDKSDFYLIQLVSCFMLPRSMLHAKRSAFCLELIAF